MNKIKITKPPFPYFGGKSLAAALIWSGIGDVDNYIEPFATDALFIPPHPRRHERSFKSNAEIDMKITLQLPAKVLSPNARPHWAGIA